MNSLNILTIMPNTIKKWAKPFADAVLGTLKQISGVPFNKHFAFVSPEIAEDELEKIKDQIIRTDLFVFILSPEYVQFEQTHGLLQLVKAREANIGADHKVVFAVLRETCKMQPYFLQKPLFDFIGESFNTPTFKSKYVKLVKDIVVAMKASDKLVFEKSSSEAGAEAIPLNAETSSVQTEVSDAEPVTQETPTDTSVEEESEPVMLQSPAPQPSETNSEPANIESGVAEKADEDDFEPVDFLEPFNNDAIPAVDAIPAAPAIEEKPLPQEPDIIEEALEENVQPEEEARKSDSEELDFDQLMDFSELDEPAKSEPKPVQEPEKEFEDFEGFDEDDSGDISEESFDEIELEEDIVSEKIDQPIENSIDEEEIADEEEENIEEKINSDFDMSDEDDILSEIKDEPIEEGANVEPLEPVNDLNTDDGWDSFLDEEKKADPKPDPIPSIPSDEEEELEPWTGSARTYEDPDVKKKKTEKLVKQKSKTEQMNKEMKPGTKKLRPKRRRRQKLETDADIIAGEVADDGFDLLEELGIDIDNIPEIPEPKEKDPKKDTASIDDLLDQEDLSLDDDLSFDNELVLDDLEDESVEDDNVGAEYGMSKITLTDDTEEKKTKKFEKDIVDELDLGDDLDAMDIPKGNCTVFMNKVPENRYDEAIRMIKEINGMDESEIEILLGRIVVPVLKDVFPEEAEKALDRIKRAGFNGRIRKT